jgi:hypothetical protein
MRIVLKTVSIVFKIMRIVSEALPNIVQEGAASHRPKPPSGCILP